MSDVRFARVPTGRETCGFCFMLASQGYVYRSAATAARSHPGCDCVAVPGIPDPGDDERFAGMRQRWQDCLDAVDNGSTLRRGKAAWAAIDGAERARHAGKRGGEAAFRVWYRDDFLVREACREVERRDRGWLYDGVRPEVDYSASPRLSYGRMLVSGDYSPENIVDRGREWRDLYVHDLLAENGFDVAARAADAPDGFSNIDLLIGGRLWEVKSPEEPDRPPRPGRELSFVESSLRSAKKQFHNQYDQKTGSAMAFNGPVSVVFNNLYRDAADKDVMEKIEREMARHEIDEVLFVGKDGKITRLKR